MKKMLLSLVLLSSTAFAQAPQFSADRLTQDIKTLSSDAFEGRGPATPGEEKSIAYIAQGMQAAGLQPAGDVENGKRGWYQKVPLLRASIRAAQPKVLR